MADMFVVNTGKALWFPSMLGTTPVTEDYVVDLFTNNVTVSDTTIASNLTPGSWTGYAQAAVAKSTFTYSETSNIGTETSSVSPTFLNSSGSSVNVYGWMMRGASSGTLYVAQTFASAPISITNGFQLSLTPFAIQLKAF